MCDFLWWNWNERIFFVTVAGDTDVDAGKELRFIPQEIKRLGATQVEINVEALLHVVRSRTPASTRTQHTDTQARLQTGGQ